MTEQKTETNKPAKKAETRKYFVLEEVTASAGEGAPQTFELIAVVPAIDEKAARWIAVDNNEELAKRVKAGSAAGRPVKLVAISERNWSLRETAEELVTVSKRS